MAPQYGGHAEHGGQCDRMLVADDAALTRAKVAGQPVANRAVYDDPEMKTSPVAFITAPLQKATFDTSTSPSESSCESK